MAPEYVFISKSKQDEAVRIMRKYLMEFYGENGDTERSDAYYHIVSDRHFNRLQKVRAHYLEGQSGQIAIGGTDDGHYGPQKVNAKNRHLPPMLSACPSVIMSIGTHWHSLSVVTAQGASGRGL